MFYSDTKYLDELRARVTTQIVSTIVIPMILIKRNENLYKFLNKHECSTLTNYKKFKISAKLFLQIHVTTTFRISNGKFTLNGVEYRLRKNEGGNHLHGGVKGFNVANWAVHVDNRSNAVTFR